MNPSNETVKMFQAYQRQIKQARKRVGTHIKYLCSELKSMIETYPVLRDLLDDSVHSTMRYHNR